MDLGRDDNEGLANRDFVAAQEVDVDDYFTFVIKKTDKLDATWGGTSVRYHVTASLAGRRFEQVIVDVGFADPLILPAETLNALEFAIVCLARALTVARPALLARSSSATTASHSR